MTYSKSIVTILIVLSSVLVSSSRAADNGETKAILDLAEKREIELKVPMDDDC